MGYVNDTQMSQFIPAALAVFSAGTWTPALSSNVCSMDRTAADASFTAHIPVVVPGNAAAFKGAKLKSIDVYYSIGTAAADDFATVELEKMTLPATGSAVTGAAVSTTIDTAHDSAAERKAVDSHKMTVTLDTPAFIDDNDGYQLILTVDAAATTVFKLIGAVAHYELRV